MFDGDESQYELWETKVLGNLHLLVLKETVSKEPRGEVTIAPKPGIMLTHMPR